MALQPLQTISRVLHRFYCFQISLGKVSTNFALHYNKQHWLHDQFGLRAAKAWQVSHHANNLPDAHAVIQCWDTFTNRQQWTLGTRTTSRSKAMASLNQFCKMAQRHSCCFRWTLQPAFLSPSALNAFDYDFSSTRQISQRPWLSSLLRSHVALQLLFTDCEHLIHLIIFPVLNVLLLSLPNQPECLACTHTHTQTLTRRPCKHNIIGQRWECISQWRDSFSPGSGELIIRSVKYSWGLHSHVELLLNW